MLPKPAFTDPYGRGREEVLPTVAFRDLPLEHLNYFKPPLIWSSKTAYPKNAPLDLDVYSRSINIVCGQHSPTNLRVSLKMALDIARAPRKMRVSSPLRAEGLGVDKHGAIVRPDERSVLETYDLSRKPDPSQMANVLYINTLTPEWVVNNELLGLWPELERWALDCQEGKVRPRPDLWMPLHLMTAEPGDLLLHREILYDVMHQKNINVVVLNSFENSCASERHKRELMLFLRSFQHTMRTVIVFSHEKAERLRAGCASRVLGNLTMIAAAVVRLDPLDESSIEFATSGELGEARRTTQPCTVRSPVELVRIYYSDRSHQDLRIPRKSPPDDRALAGVDPP